MTKSILSLPYDERRVIGIRPSTPDEEAASDVDWGAVAASGLFTAMLPGAWLAKKLVEKLISRNSDNAPVTWVDMAAARSELSFPPGHPQRDAAYVGHPLRAAEYAPLATFHRRIFEEKVNELITLLASLGATRVRVECHKGYRESAGISLGVPEVGSVNVEGGTRRTQSAYLEETYRPQGVPSIPEDLVWFEHEPSWKALADRRLRHGSTSFRARLSYEDDCGVNVGLSGQLEGVNINIGGRFEAFEATLWEFSGEFA